MGGPLTAYLSPLTSHWSFTDREGFEPSIPLPVYRFSRPAPSATRTPVQRAAKLAGTLGAGQDDHTALAYLSSQPLQSSTDFGDLRLEFRLRVGP